MYDCIIIGSGVAGMSAAIYLKRASKKVLIIEKETIGGQISSSPLVENYPGFISISGSELANNMFEQVLNLGVEVLLEEVIKIEDGQIKKVITKDNIYETKTIIVATGAKHRLLGLPNEINLIGKGIHFCVSCDGAFYKEKTVAVIGGGNSALINALALADIAKHVYIIQNLKVLSGEVKLQEELKTKNNIEIIYNSKVIELIGEDELKEIVIDNTSEKRNLKIDGMFISIGLIPQTKEFANDLLLTKDNYIKSDDCKTNILGVYVAGDVRQKEIRQLTTATSDGTIAALLAISYLK
ncbi:MAG: FAD-dependent oxidoreductase [Bacilli bacterium]